MMPTLDSLVDPTAVTVALGVLAGRAAVLFAAAALATMAMRRASAANRHLVWSGAFAGALLLPFIGAMLPAWRLLPAASRPPARVTPAASMAAVASRGVAEAAAPAPSPTTVRVRTAPAPRARLAPANVVATQPAEWSGSTGDARSASALEPPATTSGADPGVGRSIAWPAVIVVGWLAGLALLFARLVVGTLTLRRLVGRTRPIDDQRMLLLAERLCAQLGIRRRVRLLVDVRATVPMTWGIAAPVVVLPAESAAWSDDRRRLVLAHELAHVARLDGATLLVAQLASAVFWFHPLVWLALRELRREREHACDDLVLGTGARASDYARDLVLLAMRLAPSPATAAAFAMARRSELEGRVLAILDPRLARGRAGWRTASLAVAGAAVLTLAAATVGRRDAAAAAVRPSLHAPRTISRAPTARLGGPGAPGSGRDSALSASEPTPTLDAGALGAPLVSAIGGGMAAPVAPVSDGADTIPVGPAPEADRATLLMVAEAAKRISSDAEKSTLLQAVYPRYRSDDGLRAAYLGVVATLTGDNARAEALVRVARRDTLSPSVLVQAIAIAAATGSDYERGRALEALAAQRALSDPSAHRAFFQAAAQISQSSAEAGVLGAVLQRPELSEADLLSTMQAASLMSSSNEAANVLVAIVRRHPLDSDVLRSAFTAAARKLSSDSEYRRVITAAAISF